MSITEEFQKRQAEKPDTWTLAWWRSEFQEVLRAYRGATHAMNLAQAEVADFNKLLREALDRIQTLESDRELDRAKIGELQARLDRQAEFLTELKKTKGTK